MLISTVSQLKTLVEEIAPVIENMQFDMLAEIDQRTFSLSFFDKEKRVRLLLSLQEPLLGFHITSKKHEIYHTGFSKALDERLQGCRLISFELMNEDRIVAFRFRPHYCIVVELFPKKPNLYLLDARHTILFSLNPTKDTQYRLPDKPSYSPKHHSAAHLSNAEMEAFYGEKKQELKFLREKRSLGLEIERLLRKSQKEKDKWSKRHELCSQWIEKQHEAALLQANLYRMTKGMVELTVSDWEQNYTDRVIKLNPKLEPSKEVARRFRESQKLRDGLPVAAQYLLQTESDQNFWTRWSERIEQATTLDDLKKIRIETGLSILTEEKQTRAKESKAQPYYEFISASGLSIKAGKNAQANDALTFSFAKGADIWLHVSGYPGSHVVISVPKGRKATSEDLEEAMQIALAYSQAKDKGEVEIIITQRKYVSRLGKGRTGKVQISQHETRWAAFDKERFAGIKERDQSSSLKR